MPEPRWPTGLQQGSPEWYQMLAWVKASQRRVEILTALEDGPKNSTDFAERWEVSPEAVQYHLKLLKEGGPDEEFPQLIEILTPNRQQYRLYGLTDKGSQVVKYLD